MQRASRAWARPRRSPVLSSSQPLTPPPPRSQVWTRQHASGLTSRFSCGVKQQA